MPPHSENPISSDAITLWFEILRGMQPGIETVYLMLKATTASRLTSVFTFPESANDREELAKAAELAYYSGNVIKRLGSGAPSKEGHIIIARPLTASLGLQGAVVARMSGSSTESVALAQALEVGDRLLGVLVEPEQVASTRHLPGRLIDVARSASSTTDLYVSLLSELAHGLGSERVFLGNKERDKTTLLEVSGSIAIGDQGTKAKSVSQLLESIADYPGQHAWPNADSPAGPALQHYAEANELATVVSTVIGEATEQVWIFVFEYPQPTPDDDEWLGAHTLGAEISAALLNARLENARPWWQRAIRLAKQGIRQLFAPKNAVRTPLLAVSTLAGVLFLFADTTYRISAPAFVEGEIQRTLVAPYDGFVDKAMVRAGQQVDAGEILITLDSRELKEDQRRLLAEHSELEKQQRQAIARLDQGEASILEARREQKQAQLELIEHQLERIAIRAPFDGLITSGDWSRGLGTPVSRGDTLFVVAIKDRFRIAIDVPERHIDGLREGQNGSLLLTARPGDPLPFELSGITSLARSDIAEPVFRVEALPKSATKALRPGMQGIAKIDVGERQRLWVWTHQLTDWIRLQLWQWLP